VTTADDRENELNRLYDRPLTPDTAKRIQQLIREQIDENGLKVRTMQTDGTWIDESIPPKNERN
jgi:hypothetical protein